METVIGVTKPANIVLVLLNSNVYNATMIVIFTWVNVRKTVRPILI